MTTLAAVGALVERDLRALVRSRSQLYSSLLTPLLFLLFLGIGVSDGLEPSALSDGDFTAYLAAGAAVMTAVFSSTFSAASYYRDRDSGFLRVVLATPLPGRTVLAARALSGVVVGSLQCLAVIAVAAPLVDLQWQYGTAGGIALAVVGIAFVNAMLAGLAAALATRIDTMQGFHLVMNLVLFPLLFFSGAFFPIDGLPGWFRVLAFANPLTYAVDALQQAMYASSGDGYIGLAIDLPVLAALAAAALAGGFGRSPRLTWSGR